MNNSDESIVLLTDAVFFTETVPAPSSLGSKDLADLAETVCEASAPISPDKLRKAYFKKKDKLTVFAGMADILFEDISKDRLAKAKLVMPSACAFSALDIPDGTWLLQNSESFAKLEVVNGAWKDFESLDFAPKNQELKTIQLLDCKVSRRGKLEIEFSIDGNKKRQEIPMKNFASCELRPRSEVLKINKQKRKYAFFEYSIKSVPIILILLLLWQIFNFWRASNLNSLDDKIAELSPLASAVEKASEESASLRAFTGKKLHPTIMLAIVNASRPDELNFAKCTFTSPYELELQGRAPSIKNVDDFIKQLKQDARIEKADAKSESSKSEARFSMSVKFKK